MANNPTSDMTVHDDDDHWGTYDSGVPLVGDGYRAAPGEDLIEIDQPVDGFPGWVATWLFLVVKPPEPIAVRLRYLGPDQRTTAITAQLLRKVSPDRARQRFSEVHLASEVGLLFNEAFDATDATARPGRRGRDDRFYAVLVRDYSGLVATSPTPVKELANKLGYSASQIRNLLYTARQRGLLTASEPGKAGGDETDKCREILDGAR